PSERARRVEPPAASSAAAGPPPPHRRVSRGLEVDRRVGLQREMSTGASNVLERAAVLTRKLVTDFGTTDRLGVDTFGSSSELGWPAVGQGTPGGIRTLVRSPALGLKAPAVAERVCPRF